MSNHFIKHNKLSCQSVRCNAGQTCFDGLTEWQQYQQGEDKKLKPVGGDGEGDNVESVVVCYVY